MNKTNPAPKVGDFIDFRSATNPALGYSRDVLSLNEHGHPVVEIDGKHVTVHPERIQRVYPR